MATNKKKIWTYVLVALGILVIILIIMYFRKRDVEVCPDGKTPVPKDGVCPPDSIPTNPVPDPVTGCISPSSYRNWNYPMGLGMKDSQYKRVSELQAKLNLRYLAGLKVDGFFGCKTLAAIKKYLNVDTVDETNAIWNIPTPILT